MNPTPQPSETERQNAVLCSALLEALAYGLRSAGKRYLAIGLGEQQSQPHLTAGLVLDGIARAVERATDSACTAPLTDAQDKPKQES